MKLTYILLIGILLLASFLRFYKFDEIPHGLYIDEVSFAYNSYTILTKGVDEHGVPYPLFFKAFGEYKLPVHIYMTAASFAVFGKNEFAVRFPSALFGTFTVLLLYLFVRKLFAYRATKQNVTQNYTESLALLSAFFLAITPWHIHFSRANFEANIAVFIYLLGGVLFLTFLQRKNKWVLFCSFLAFLLTAYTYNAYRFIAPLTIVVCSFFVFRSFSNLRKFLMTTLAVLFLLFLPLLLFSLTAAGGQRYSTETAFSGLHDLSPVEKAITYPAAYLKNYLTYFSISYLFSSGDGFGRHTVVGMGNLFRFEFLFLIAGLFFLLQKRREFFAKMLFFFVLIAPSTAAFASPSPHSLRSLLLVVPFSIIIAYGMVRLWEKKFFLKRLLFFGIFLFAVYESFFYLHLYYVHYPIRTALDWGAEYKAVIVEATKQQNNYSRIVINDNLLMFNTWRNFYDDQFAYELVNDSWIKTKPQTEEKILYITNSDEKRNAPLEKVPRKLIKTIDLRSDHRGIFAQFWEL